MWSCRRSVHLACLCHIIPTSIETTLSRATMLLQRSFATRVSTFDTLNTVTRTQKSRQTPDIQNSQPFADPWENESKQSFTDSARRNFQNTYSDGRTESGGSDKRRQPIDGRKFKNYDPRLNSTNFQKYQPKNEYGRPMRYRMRDKVIENDKDRERILGTVDGQHQRSTKRADDWGDDEYDEDDVPVRMRQATGSRNERPNFERLSEKRTGEAVTENSSGEAYRDSAKKESRETPTYNHGLPGVGKASPNKIKALPIVMGEILFGVHPTLMALTRGHREVYRLFMRDRLATFDRPFVKALLTAAEEKQVEVQFCTKTLLNTLSMSRPHQGVCLDVGKIDFEQMTSLPTTGESTRPLLWVVLDSVQDPMNFGAIVRTAYYLGADRLLAVQKNSCSLTPVVSKASAGTIEISRIYAIPDLVDFLKEAASNGWMVLGTTGSLEGSTEKITRLEDFTMTSNTILILGNEGRGLREDVLEVCHKLMCVSSGADVDQSVDSLNVSVAAGIILHHLSRSRSG